MKLFGKYYYKRLKKEEFQRNFSSNCSTVVTNTIHTELQLADFMAHE